MQTYANDKNPCNDRWLAALVDAMDEVEELRSDDICRGSFVPAGLIAQLGDRKAFAETARRPAASLIQLT